LQRFMQRVGNAVTTSIEAVHLRAIPDPQLQKDLKRAPQVNRLDPQFFDRYSDETVHAGIRFLDRTPHGQALVYWLQCDNERLLRTLTQSNNIALLEQREHVRRMVRILRSENSSTY